MVGYNLESNDETSPADYRGFRSKTYIVLVVFVCLKKPVTGVMLH